MVGTSLNSNLLEIHNHTIRVLRKGGGTRPHVLVVDHLDGMAVLKDHNGSDIWFSRLIGPLLTQREVRALRQLHAVQGIPNLLERVDRRALLMDYLDAVQLGQVDTSVDWPVFFERLAALVGTMHQHGVAHCDLRSPGNTLVDKEDRAYLVDFVACVFQGRRWNLPGQWLFAKFKEADRSAILKLKLRFAPELLNDPERQSLQYQSPLDRIARLIGSSIRNLSRRLFADSK